MLALLLQTTAVITLVIVEVIYNVPEHAGANEMLKPEHFLIGALTHVLVYLISDCLHSAIILADNIQGESQLSVSYNKVSAFFADLMTHNAKNVVHITFA